MLSFKWKKLGFAPKNPKESHSNGGAEILVDLRLKIREGRGGREEVMWEENEQSLQQPWDNTRLLGLKLIKLMKNLLGSP